MASSHKPEFWQDRVRRTALKGLSGGVLYGLFIEPRWVETTLLDFYVVGLPRQLDGYRIAHLTDIHHNWLTGRRFLERIIARTNAMHPDLVVLTGDYITHSADRMRSVSIHLRGLRAHDGILATLGNHDYICPVHKTRRYFRAAGITLLDNEHHIIYPRRLLAHPDDEFPSDSNKADSSQPDLKHGAKQSILMSKVRIPLSQARRKTKQWAKRLGEFGFGATPSLPPHSLNSPHSPQTPHSSQLPHGLHKQISAISQ